MAERRAAARTAEKTSGTHEGCSLTWSPPNGFDILGSVLFGGYPNLGVKRTPTGMYAAIHVVPLFEDTSIEHLIFRLSRLGAMSWRSI